MLVCISLYANNFDDEYVEKLELFKLSNQIRGSNYECEGYKYIKSLHKYQHQILQSINNPKQNLSKSIFKDENSYKNSLKYFKYWGTQSIGNFRLYTKFLEEKEKTIDKFKDKFQNENYAKNLVKIFEKRAFGEIENFNKTNDFSDFIINNDSSNIEAYIIKNSLDRFELTKGLQIALLYKKDIKVLKTLLKYGAKINDGYESAIFFALDYDEGLLFLIQNKADVNYTNFFGKTPLFYAVENNNIKAVKILLDNGALINYELISINELDVVGAHLPYYMKTCSFIHGKKNIFMHASSYASEDMLKMLVEYGAKYDNVDDLGFNALDFALTDGNENAIKYLNSLGLKPNRQINPMLNSDEIFFDEYDGSEEDEENNNKNNSSKIHQTQNK